MATHSNILAQRIPQTEEPGELQSMGLQRVGYDQTTNTHTQQKKMSRNITFRMGEDMEENLAM